MNRPVRSAYLHIPFCPSKCAYCDFNSVPLRAQTDLSDYVNLLIIEIDRTADWLAKRQPDSLVHLDTVYFGGGTPSLLTPEQFARILARLKKRFGFRADAECTAEANPGTVTEEVLVRLRETGLNRLSFGVQALQQHLLTAIGRRHTPAEAIQALERAAAAGFGHLNADLMTGLPGQTLADVEASIRGLLATPINHMSVYSLTLEPNTPLGRRATREPELLPDDSLEREQHHLAFAMLEHAGFYRYEISNAARAGCISRHNLTYWRAQPYYGFGAGAHSYLAGQRMANPGRLSDYRRSVLTDAGVDAQTTHPFQLVEELIHEPDEKKETIMLALRLTAGLSERRYQARFGTLPEADFGRAIRSLLKRGLLCQERERLLLTPVGLDYANQVFAEFV